MFNTDLTAHLAELSKLKFTEEELEKMTEEMDSIVNLMDTVSEFETGEDFPVTDKTDLSSIREDKDEPSMDRDLILKNAKDNGDTYFKVPKVV